MSDDKDDIIATAKKRFDYAVERNNHNVTRAKEDIRFAAASPDDPWQWKDADLKARGNRPTLTINKLPQHIRQVTNDIKQNRPSIKYRPADSKTDVKSADILMGIARHIESNSDADVAYDAAADAMVQHGVGYVRVLHDYVSDRSFDQDIFIRPVFDPLLCHDDPDALDPAGADRKFFFIEESMTEEDFKREHPKNEPIDWNHDVKDGWFGSDKKIRTAEYFEVCYRDRTLYFWGNGATSFDGDDMPPGVYKGERPLKERKVNQSYVMWRKINGKEVLKDSAGKPLEREFPCRWIPVARAIGNRFFVDGKVYVSGLVRNTKDSVRMYNVAQSAIVERVMQAPKTPWAAPVEAISGYEHIWKTANTGDHAFLPYNHVDDAGGAVPPPVRTAPTQIEAGLIEIARGSADDIKSETGQFDASLGARSNETSGKAIMARQREGDIGNFHYMDHLSWMVRHVGRIVLDMMPAIYDAARVARILGEDGSPDNVHIDPKSPQALVEARNEQGEIQRIFNPNIGTYDVYTTTGPSFTTRRQEAVEAMSQMTQANPELWRVIGDQLVKNMDWPGAEDMAKRLKAVLLPQVAQADDENGSQVPPEVQQQMQQMQQQMQQMMQALQEASQKVQELESDKQGKFNEQLIKAYDAETKRIQALGGAMTPNVVQQLVMQTLQQVMATPSPAAEIGEGDEPEPPQQMMQEQAPSGAFSLPASPAVMPATGA